MIHWSEIEAECGNYRQGFVAVFRKYEGQPTDEKDKKNRTVKVTVTSFARHVGIPEPTFRRWVTTVKRTVLPEEREQMDASKARKILREASPEQLGEILSTLGEEKRLQISAAATKPEMDQLQREHVKRRKHREETPGGLDADAHLVQLDLSGANERLRSGIRTAGDVTWSEELSSLLLARTATTAELLDVLRLALSNAGDVDWDSELARLTDEERSGK